MCTDTHAPTRARTRALSVVPENHRGHTCGCACACACAHCVCVHMLTSVCCVGLRLLSIALALSRTPSLLLPRCLSLHLSFVPARAGNLNLTKRRQACQPYRRRCSAGRLFFLGGVDKYTAHTSQHMHGHASTHTRTRTHTRTLCGPREPQRAYVCGRVRVCACCVCVRMLTSMCCVGLRLLSLTCSLSLSLARPLSYCLAASLCSCLFVLARAGNLNLTKTKTSVSTIPVKLFGWTSFRWRG